MKPENTWVLEYCRPVYWTVNLTPPEGEWDYEVEPGSDEEKSLKNQIMFYDFRAVGDVLSDFFSQVGSELSSRVKIISDAVNPYIEKMAEDLKPACKVMEELIAKHEADHEEYLKQQGIHTVRSIRPELKLPTRTFNAGPQVKKTGRRQTG